MKLRIRASKLIKDHCRLWVMVTYPETPPKLRALRDIGLFTN